MSGKPWTTTEERLLVLGAGIESVSQLAARLNRSEDSIKSHAAEMRRQGRLKSSLRLDEEIEYVSDLVECAECRTPRTSVDVFGVCKVCRDKQRLEEYHDRAERAFAAMPRELRERSTASHDILRDIAIGNPPSPPNTAGLDEFWAAKAEDDYFVELEQYELRKLKLDKDAVKQRKSKWLRKAREWRSRQG